MHSCTMPVRVPGGLGVDFGGLSRVQNSIMLHIKLKGMAHSDFIGPFVTHYMGVIPNPKNGFIFPIPCILILIFQFL